MEVAGGFLLQLHRGEGDGPRAGGGPGGVVNGGGGMCVCTVSVSAPQDKTRQGRARQLQAGTCTPYITSTTRQGSCSIHQHDHGKEGRKERRHSLGPHVRHRAVARLDDHGVEGEAGRLVEEPLPRPDEGRGGGARRRRRRLEAARGLRRSCGWSRSSRAGVLGVVFVVRVEVVVGGVGFHTCC